MGSREPVADGTVLLDVGELDTLRALSTEGGWAIVEPGVTQGELAARLRGTDRMLNVTASSAHTSVLGNALDRGVGLRRQRVADLVGLEIVLPDGELVRIGWWPDLADGTSSAIYPYGLGPSLVQLFAQSDLGVATAGVVRLMPRPERMNTERFEFDRQDLLAAVDELRRWVRQGLVNGVVKIYDATANQLYGAASAGYRAHVCIDGLDTAVERVSEVVAAEAARSSVLTRLPEPDGDDVVSTMVDNAYAGDPDTNDWLLEATFRRSASEVDEGELGWLFFLPLVPFTGEDVAHAYELLECVHRETGVRPGATVNALDGDVVDFVVSMKYPRRTAEAEDAHRALDRLYELFGTAGYRPYRLDVDHAGWNDGAPHTENARCLSRRIKDLIDPNFVLAPGRYR
ncbi:4-cresol dehydrogenase (hydroxylating) [Actinopolyspora lacussalsi]|nr:4-cresol dehydrogenase (hydroxylating) [Actinopolyspora lacussalsi]